jgi:hypothetical protein
MPTGSRAARSKRTFQWAHARDLKPDPDDLNKIVEKLRTAGWTSDAGPKRQGRKKPGDGG